LQRQQLSKADILDILADIVLRVSSSSLYISEMWYHVFLWALFSSFLVHAVASAIAFCRLRSHKIGRFIPVAILAMGIIWPITGGAITSMYKSVLFYRDSLFSFPYFAHRQVFNFYMLWLFIL